MKHHGRREHRERHTAKLLSVSESVAGTTLSADAAVGATTLFVDDVSVFDESGWLMVGSQVTKYTAIDDDAGTVTLKDALTAAADTDDQVARYSKLYDAVETVLSAQVAVLGSRDQGDELTVEVADWVDLPTGDRGLDGENCTIESDGDVWTLISASGRPSKARGLKFEADDFYVLTSTDITAGTATIPLSHRPVDESVKLWWRTVAQEPTEYTVNVSAQTIALPLGSFAAAGDRIWVHYAYRTGLAKQTGPVDFVEVGHTDTSSTFGSITTLAWPAGTQSGDLFVLGLIAGTVSCTDSRATQVGSDVPIWVDAECGVWVGQVGNPATPLTLSGTAATSWGSSGQLYVLRPDSPISFDGRSVTGVDARNPIGGLSGSGSGAVGVAFSAAGIGGSFGWSWPSPWASQHPVGTYFVVNIALQSSPTTGSTAALTTYESRAWVLGLGLG